MQAGATRDGRGGTRGATHGAHRIGRRRPRRATRRPRRIRFWSTHPHPHPRRRRRRPNHPTQPHAPADDLHHRLRCAAAGRAELTPGPDPGSGRSLRPAGGLPPANAHLPHRRRCLLLPPLSTASCGCSPGTNHSSRAGAVPCPGDVAVGRSSAARSAQFLLPRGTFLLLHLHCMCMNHDSAGEAIQLTCTTTADR